MAQRVVIAMALVGNPQVLLADDATLGLDATVQAQILDMLVQRCRERGLSVMLITHDLGIVRHYCDRVAVIRNGALIETRDVAPFLKAPVDPYSRALFDSARARPTPAPALRGAGERPLVEARRLIKIYGSPFGHQVQALDRASFQIRPHGDARSCW